MKLLLTVFTAIILLSVSADAQKADIQKYMDMISEGKSAQVKSELLDLMAEYPGDPGVMLLHGMVLNDGVKSIKIFEKIVKDFPENTWASTAYYFLIEYYVLLDELDMATIKLNSLKKAYNNKHDFGYDISYKFAQNLVQTALKLKKTKGTSKQKVKIVYEERMIEPQETEDLIIKTEKIPVKQTEKPKDIEAENIIVYKSVPVGEVKKTEGTMTAVREVPKAQTTTNSSTYGLQVGIFSNKDNATAEMRKFLKQRMRTEVKEKYVNNKRMYAVVIGNYTSRESANAAKLIVKEQCECEPVVFEK